MKLLLIFLLTPILLVGQTQIGNDIDGAAPVDVFGKSVSLSIDGTIVAIGGDLNDESNVDAGHVRIYENVNGSWTQIGDAIDGEDVGDRSGISVSLSSNGSIVAIGAFLNDDNGNNSGHVRIYENVGGAWIQIGQDIDGEAEDNQSGFSVSLSGDGNVVAIGAPRNDGNGDLAGHVRVYENLSGTWTQIGNDIDGDSPGDGLGWSVGLSSNGSIVAVGAPFSNRNGDDSGYGRVLENVNGTWVQIGEDIEGESIFNAMGKGISISPDGNIFAVGAPGASSFFGTVGVFKNENNEWVQIDENISGSGDGDDFGSSISLSNGGTVVAIGGRGHNVGADSDIGHVKIYQTINDIWTQIGTDIVGEAGDDESGTSVSLSSDASTVAIGAPLNDDNGQDSGHARIYDLINILSVDDILVGNITIYPNPAARNITISLPNELEVEKISLYTTAGSLIDSYDKTNINVTNLKAGLYFVQIVDSRGSVVSKKFIIE